MLIATAWIAASCALDVFASAPTSLASQAAPSRPAQDRPVPTAPVAPATGRSAPAVPPSPSASGPVRLEPARIDFGFVRPHTKLDSTVSIVNDLDQPLTISAAQPTCQCTTVDLVGKVIPARGKLDFPISMKVSSTGLKQAAVQIAIEGAGFERVLVVELSAQVVYSIRAVTQNAPGGPWDPFIDAATNPARVRGEVKVESLDGKPFKVLSVGMKPPQFLDWAPSQAPKSSYRVRYDVSAVDCPSMPRYLILETDRTDAPLIDMRVRHECTHIKPAVGFAEFRANAGIVSPSSPGTFEIEIKRMKTPAGVGRVLGVSSMRSDMKAELVEQTNDGESVLATVRLTPLAGASGVMLFPVKFAFELPGQPRQVEEQLLVYAKAVP